MKNEAEVQTTQYNNNLFLIIFQYNLYVFHILIHGLSMETQSKVQRQSEGKM